MAKEGAPEEIRWCMEFNELDKPMVLNSTNGQIIAGITKSEETDEWTGHKVVLYDDPNVSFGGKLVGGIRARAPRPQAKVGPAKPAPTKPQPKPAPGPEPSPEAMEDSDTPF